MSENFSKELPPDVRVCLWSYDTDQINLKRDKQDIIVQVLNYGRWEAIKWLFKIYSEEEIKEIVSTPSRGRWFKQALNFWLTQFDLTIPPDVYRRATAILYPDPEAFEKFFKEKQLGIS